jgi:cytidine deaminase
VIATNPAVRGVVSDADAQRLARELGVGVPQLMSMLLPFAAKLAKPPVSNFYVGAVSRGLSGNLYYGCNVEFAGEALSFTVHAEQSSVTNAWMEGEEGIDAIAVTAAPCGYCRQFLNELATADRLIINDTHALAALLPAAFGPKDLGIEGGLMQRDMHRLTIDTNDELAQKALAAANMSYAPYSKSFAGIALKAGGAIFTGAYAENAAFNPSMSPLEVALSRMNLAGVAFDAIEDAVLVHVDAMHLSATETVLRAVTKTALRNVAATPTR